MISIGSLDLDFSGAVEKVLWSETGGVTGGVGLLFTGAAGGVAGVFAEVAELVEDVAFSMDKQRTSFEKKLSSLMPLLGTKLFLRFITF